MKRVLPCVVQYIGVATHDVHAVMCAATNSLLGFKRCVLAAISADADDLVC